MRTRIGDSITAFFAKFEHGHETEFQIHCIEGETMGAKPLVILLSGKMGSGKTTTADLLASALSARRTNNVYRTRFAKPLYEMHDAVLPIARRYGIPVEQKEKDLLQLIGTEWGRHRFGPNIWAHATRNEVEAMNWPEEFNNYVIIDDARFESEMLAFPNAFTIRLECPREVRMARCEAWRDRENHPSEVGLDGWDSWFMKIQTDKILPEKAVLQILEMLCED